MAAIVYKSLEDFVSSFRDSNKSSLASNLSSSSSSSSSSNVIRRRAQPLIEVVPDDFQPSKHTSQFEHRAQADAMIEILTKRIQNWQFDSLDM